MSNIYGKGAKGRATKLHALIIRDLGYCESCGSSGPLHCAHIISRKYSQTRTSSDNAFCLCASCHARYTDHPVEFGKFVTDMMGEEKYNELKLLSNLTDKVDWEVEANRLKQIAKKEGII